MSEAQTLLNGDQRLRLDPADVSLLVDRTEGWPAGIYLAALSLRHRDDPHEFIENFAGDDRNVVDYLTTEVLTDQPTEVHEFLLLTSVLERLDSGPVRPGDGQAEVGPGPQTDRGVQRLPHRPRQQAGVVPLPPPLP